jgi:hypothetical protein
MISQLTVMYREHYVVGLSLEKWEPVNNKLIKIEYTLQTKVILYQNSFTSDTFYYHNIVLTIHNSPSV